MTITKLRFRVRAWGSDEYPDLDYETDDPPKDLGWKYPLISVACLTAIPHSAIEATLEQQNVK